MKKRFLCAALSAAMAASMLTGCGFGGKKTGQPDKEDTEGQNPDADTTADTETDTDGMDGEGTDAGGQNGKTVAILMPDNSKRWAADAENMKKGLEAKGYTVDTQFAQNNAKEQASQIGQFIAKQADCIVIAAADPYALTDAADDAKQANIPIIAYDRLLMDTDAVWYYVTPGHKETGNRIGLEIIKRAKLDKLDEGEYKTAEFFMGPSDDANARLVYIGMMEALQPYLDNGKLVCKTGRTAFEDTSIPGWSQETAKEWCKNYLEGYYADEELDICATAYDGYAYGCKEALTAAGYVSSNWPVISGQGCEALACKNILDGTQSFSVFTDTRVMAQRCVAMADAAILGTEAEINDTESYDNNKLTVPAYACSPTMADKDTLQEAVIDSGFLTQEEIESAQETADKP